MTENTKYHLKKRSYKTGHRRCYIYKSNNDNSITSICTIPKNADKRAAKISLLVYLKEIIR